MLSDDVHANAAPITYEEQNSTVVPQLEVARSGFGVRFFAMLPEGVLAIFLFRDLWAQHCAQCVTVQFHMLAGARELCLSSRRNC
jgi:hypothetical protein